MKKYVYPILSALAGAAILGISSWWKLMEFGGNSCDFPGKNCDCFCCNSFGLRGYEACGAYGWYVGTGIGAVIGLLVYLTVKKLDSQKNNKE